MAARASGAGAAVTIAVVNRVHWTRTGERPAPTADDEEQCGICREGGGQARQLRRWPGGCPQWFHDECIAALYQHTDGGRPACPTCRAGLEGCPQPTHCDHGEVDVCHQGCGERCARNMWTGAVGCPTCGWPAGLDGGPGHEAARRNQMNALMRELQRLSEQGVPNGYQWSRVLCPFIWTALNTQSDFHVGRDTDDGDSTRYGSGSGRRCAEGTSVPQCSSEDGCELRARI